MQGGEYCIQNKNRMKFRINIHEFKLQKDNENQPIIIQECACNTICRVTIIVQSKSHFT